MAYWVALLGLIIFLVGCCGMIMEKRRPDPVREAMDEVSNVFNMAGERMREASRRRSGFRAW